MVEHGHNSPDRLGPKYSTGRINEIPAWRSNITEAREKKIAI